MKKKMNVVTHRKSRQELSVDDDDTNELEYVGANDAMMPRSNNDRTIRSLQGTATAQNEIGRDKRLKKLNTACVMHQCISANVCEHQCAYIRCNLIKYARTNESATNSTHDDPTNGTPRIVNNIVELNGAVYVSE